VLPEAEEVDVQLKPEDLEITVCRASGPGGQGVNTTDSAVQIIHKPTGVIVRCADGRSQQKNKQRALTVLRSRLLETRVAEENAKYAAQRKAQVGTGERNERIRTYNFPQNRVTDHRIELTLYNLARHHRGRRSRSRHRTAHGRRPPLAPRPPSSCYANGDPEILGQFVREEITNASGLGAVNVHWLPGGAPPPFGRPAGYENNLCRWPNIEIASHLILFGDGHSDIFNVWPNDRWWIWKELGDANSPGFNRATQQDPGAFRHNRRSNYAFADGRAVSLDPAQIPCNTDECWWSAKADPH
jgi:prepilin-type processing-associated H-X9-DG protein